MQCPRKTLPIVPSVGEPGPRRSSEVAGLWLGRLHERAILTATSRESHRSVPSRSRDAFPKLWEARITACVGLLQKQPTPRGVCTDLPKNPGSRRPTCGKVPKKKPTSRRPCGNLPAISKRTIRECGVTPGVSEREKQALYLRKKSFLTRYAHSDRAEFDFRIRETNHVERRVRFQDRNTEYDSLAMSKLQEKTGPVE